ncbi:MULTISPECIES: hypothetical protein [Halorussus]|uniref:hypothetical protein n=1 Tax=Halorussus TaxID=1070314 RepID=UPI00209D5028|nr:hypothetical protein [Halorussus vallis]USZ75281.1 hypothetical protein NGM07_17840 [Halorussus vallis]
MKETEKWDSLIWSVDRVDADDTVEITIQGRLEGLDAEERDKILREGLQPTSVNFDVGDDGRSTAGNDTTADRG